MASYEELLTPTGGTTGGMTGGSLITGHLLNEKGKRPVLETLDSQSVCPPCGQRLCCHCCVQFCSPVRAFVLACLGVVALAAGIFVLVKLGILFPDHPPPLVPAIPGGPYLSDSGALWLNVRWNRPTSDAPLTGYTFQWAPADPLPPPPPAHATPRHTRDTFWNQADLPTVLNFTITNLHPLTGYKLRVRAKSSNGFGNWTSERTFFTQNASLPSAPGAAVVTTALQNALGVQWSPSTEYGLPVAYYELQIKPQASSIWTSPYEDLQLTTQVSNLQPGTSYDFRIRAAAVQDMGNTTWSALASYHTDVLTPEAPNVTAITVLDITSASATLSWARPTDGGSEILSYTVQHDSGDCGPWTVTKKFGVTFPVSPVIATVDQLDYNTVYCFQFRATNRVDDGAWSPSVKIKTKPLGPPSPPYALTASALDQNSMTVEWKPGASPGISILGYVLEHDDWWAGVPMKPFPESLSLSHNITDLIPAVEYTYRVKERNALGWSGYSSNVTISTLTYGACGNRGDVAAWKYKRSTMARIISTCLTGCITSPDKPYCSRDCIISNVGLTSDCAQCFQDEGRCAAKECFVQCIFPYSADCAKCAKQKCFPPLLLCSGMPERAFPT